MKTKILKMLRNTDGYVSGQEICKMLGVSRTTVWKVINKLKEEGYEIEAISNKGYCLKTLPDLVTEEACASQMNTQWAGKKLVYYSQVDSTNNQAKRLGEDGAPHGTLVIADSQLAGKGRRGRNWVSPCGASIYMSLLLRPKIEPIHASMLTLVTALSVSQAMEQATGLDVKIKWPNDIVIHGKKLCGILTEMSADMDGINYVVTGVGINCRAVHFPGELQEIATSLSAEGGRQVMRSTLIARVMEQFEENYQTFLETADLLKLKEGYEARLVNRDQQVKVLSPQWEYTGISRGINRKGELLVEDETGIVRTVFSGEVSVRGVYGYI